MITDIGKLHNRTREAMLKKGLGAAALVIDGLLSFGFHHDEWVDFETVRQAFPATTSEKLLRKGLNSSTIFEMKRIKSNKRGRPPQLYKIPQESAIMRLLKVYFMVGQGDQAADYLPEWAFGSLKLYRMAMHLAFIVRQVKKDGQNLIQASVGFLAGRLSVCKKTIRNYIKALNIPSRPNFSRQKLSLQSAQYLPESDRDIDRSRFLHIGADAQSVYQTPLKWLRKYPAKRFVAESAIKQGLHVWLFAQCPNSYSIPDVREDKAGYQSENGFIVVDLSAKEIMNRALPD